MQGDIKTIKTVAMDSGYCKPMGYLVFSKYCSLLRSAKHDDVSAGEIYR
jgi:hypothetical protein